jgi:two-component system, NarL family, response regulator NreC
VTTVLIVDDHAAVRAGLRSLLSAEPDLQVIGEAADGWEAVAKAGELRPDVLIADYSMPGPDGLALARDLGRQLPATHVLILTFHEDRELMREALVAGAAGYVQKRTLIDELVPAVRAAARGEKYLPGLVRNPTEGPLPAQASAPVPPIDALNDVEVEFLLMLVKGYLPRQIAEALRIDEEGVRGVRSSLTDKLGLRNRAELAEYAEKHRLLD